MSAAGPSPAAEFVYTAPVSPVFWVTLVLYGVAGVFYYVGFFTKSPAWVTRAARWVLFLAFLSHTVEISLRGVDHVHPGTSIREATGFLSWLVVGGFLWSSVRQRVAVLGVFVAPIAAALLAVARLSPSGRATEGLNLLGRIHISLATLGVAAFAIAGGLSMVYLVQERILKGKKFEGILYRRAVALETLDKMAHRLVLVGFPLFTIGLLLGAIWGSQRSASFARPEYPIAMLAWAAFGSLIVARSVLGWRGRKAALLTVVGFTAAAVVVVIYFVRRAMG